MISDKTKQYLYYRLSQPPNRKLESIRTNLG
jgi:hypothetical protein